MKNPQLKRAYAESEYTPNSIQELVRCKRDPIYFLTTYVKVAHPVKGSVPFDLYDYQVEMVKAIHENKDSIILASRQLGKCLSGSTSINTIEPPSGSKKLLLKIVDRTTHDRIFRTAKEEGPQRSG